MTLSFSYIPLIKKLIYASPLILWNLLKKVNRRKFKYTLKTKLFLNDFF